MRGAARVLLLLALSPGLLQAQEAVPAAACKVLDPALQLRYRGPCVQGLAQGRGEAEGEGTRYQGDFVAGRRHGQGVQTWSNGDRYEGAFVEDRREGLGEYAWGRGGEWAGQRYRGGFRADQRHGEGSYHWPDGRVLSGAWIRDLPSPALAAQMAATVRASAEQLVRTSVPGTRVCRVIAVGIGGSDVVGGVVRRLDGNRLWVLIDRPGTLAGELNGQALKKGAEVGDSLEHWAVCR